MVRPKVCSYAWVDEKLGCFISEGELLERFAEGDALVSMSAFEGMSFSGVHANGATFENVVFRDCTFEAVDFSRSTFTDVLFSSCRFVRCKMERCWLSRCDMRACSAPGLSFLSSRLSGLAIADSQLRYADFSDMAAEKVAARSTCLAESLWHAARIKRLMLDACDCTRAEFFKTSLAGVDLSSSDMAGIVVSSDFRELRGAKVSACQAVELACLLGIEIAE